MYKKLSLFVAIFGIFAVVGVSHAATITPSLSFPRGTEMVIDCANDAHEFNIYQSSTYELLIADEPCDYTNTIGAIGNFIVVEYDPATLVGSSATMSYHNMLQNAGVISPTTSFQITPNFSGTGSGSSNDITTPAFTGFLTGIGSFLVANLPAVLATLAALIGLGFLLARVRRWIGKKA